MKFRFAIIVLLTTLLSACNFTLAEDVTPPPGYVPPTPVPTLGPPSQAPSTANGALIYAEKCAACHGETGMGDGEQGIQLGVTVPAFGLPEIARPAAPAQWYEVVTRGNIERFMPPFVSLSDQERWDVVAYAMTLHTSEEELAKGQELFEANCKNCSTDFFNDQQKMSALSEVELARLVKNGSDQVPAFGKALSEEEVWAVAAYLRTLSFDTAPVVSATESTATPEAAAVTGTASTTEAGTPAAEGTPGPTAQLPATSEATAVAQVGFGTVRGSIDNKTGEELPSDLKVTLRGYDHGGDPSAGPQEVFSQEGAVDADGAFVFESIEMPARRIFIAELTYEGTDLQSGFAIAEEGKTSVSLPPIILYNKTDDTSKLVVDEMQIFFQYGADGIQIVNLYTLRNPTEEIIAARLSASGEIPFIKSPEGSSGLGYEVTRDSERFLQTADGFAIPPSEGIYQLVAFASLPRAKEFVFSQEIVLPTGTVTVFVPEGVTIAGGEWKDLGLQPGQAPNTQIHIYELDGVKAGEKVELTISGAPSEGGSSSATTLPNQTLLIGVGILGVALLLVGGWMYLRDRKRSEEIDDEADEEDEFESSEDVMDAIIALDDLHRDRKISEAAYQKRRAELKEMLKGKM